eukprot:464711_1
MWVGNEEEYNYNQYENNNEYNNEYNDAYEEENELYDNESKNNIGIENNAWVWQLLILSFSLGVCSCLCYYATKVKPSNGKYDFRHHRGKYSQVGVESQHSAFDDIIDQQSDIE